MTSQGGNQGDYDLQSGLLNCTRPVGEALSLPLARSALGSPIGGAAEQSEAEGVQCVEWYGLMVLHSPCRGRQPGDPLARSALASPERGGAERT